LSTHATQISRAVADGRTELADAVGTLARKAELPARLHEVTERAGELKSRAVDLPGQAAEAVARLGEKVPDMTRPTRPAPRPFLVRHRVPVIAVVAALAAAVVLGLRSRRSHDTSREAGEDASRRVTSDRPSAHQSA
jgi:hypothetical protein